jgi:2'-5' RNA ligase
MNRIFIAFKINSTVRQEILRRRNFILDGTVNNYKWESFKKIHTTIKFVGDVDKSILSKIIDKLKCFNDYEKIESTLGNFGFFNKNNKPSILWCGFYPDKKINSIVEKLNNSLYEIGIPKEEKLFKPHLTILRIRGYEDVTLLNKFKDYNFDEMKFYLDEIAIYESKLLSSGSVYKEIKKYQLK